MATLNAVGRHGEKGQAKLALTLPLLMLIVLGVFDFGFMFQRYEVVTNAAREGARLAVLPEYTNAGQIELWAVKYLNASGLAGSSNCSATLTDGRICVAVAEDTVPIPGAGAVGPKTVKVLKVTVTYDHEHIFVGPMIQLFGGSLGTVRLSATSQMRKEST